MKKRARNSSKASAKRDSHAQTGPVDIDGLVRAAVSASKRAHSPYSGIRVGAALLARDGRVFTGCNVENASYGLTLCAERVAVVKAIADGVHEFEVIAITTNRAKTLMPCGACRQVLQEFAPRLRVVCQGTRGARREARLNELLPSAFEPRDLD